jgi:hypothetical protein
MGSRRIHRIMNDGHGSAARLSSLDDLIDFEYRASVRWAYTAESSNETAGLLKALFKRSTIVLDPIHRNAVIVDLESADAQSTRFPIRPDFETRRRTMEGDVICQWDFIALHAFAHAANSPSRFARVSF